MELFLATSLLDESGIELYYWRSRKRSDWPVLTRGGQGISILRYRAYITKYLIQLAQPIELRGRSGPGETYFRLSSSVPKMGRTRMVCVETTEKAKEPVSTGTKTKRTAAGIPTWSPTVVLISRSTAYVWQSGRDAQFSAAYGRTCHRCFQGPL